ncbi:putative RING zinc finger domain superfamily protein precursor [Zea mays]|jgi:E3 ubiquitin-protein ligase ATL6/9/15/31/42/55|uniref:RING-type E3 ubiquitin transferase n=1 Tax=Zea mays TaxID=4577 RepID=B4FZV3_MAIZE|nr:putative RING zinc finger domain superfamily protein precursor [Zea mays]ACF87646.1 unknown [Zea mays]ONM22387.1 E3 ubiquitin-protein ligase ATL6 [Zea mays]|eukprot:NP_001142103.1 putative RING zinc finger domain superfamily protein precursor [Zea mays]
MDTTLLRSNGRLLPLFLLLLAAADFTAVQGQGGQQQQPGPAGGAYYSQSFSPSMAIVIVVLIAAFFFLGFFSIYVRHCYGDGSSGYSANRPPAPGGAAARSRRQRGLDEAVLESFPTMAYADVKAHKAGKGALECAVCLSEFDDDETLRLLPKCSHVFHPDCIDTWLASHVTCPVCRANLVPDANAPPPPPPADDDAPELLPPPPVSAPPAAAAAAVVIDVDETEEERIIREEANELVRIGSVKRALRSKSGRAPARFPRSHSTGHSLAASATTGTGAGAGASTERFTLRLPEHVLRDLAAAGKLQRTTSLVAFRSSRGGSTRRGVSVRTGGGEGSSRAGRSIRLGQSGRWPSFLSRTFSARLPAWGSRSTRRGVEADGSSKGGRAAGAGAAG